jgi:hypothetical protein
MREEWRFFIVGRVNFTVDLYFGDKRKRSGLSMF